MTPTCKDILAEMCLLDRRQQETDTHLSNKSAAGHSKDSVVEKIHEVGVGQLTFCHPY